MLINYLKVAWRHIVRHKGYSFINIFGLAAGMACFLLLVLYIQFESGYDRFHQHGRDIYLATFENRGPSGTEIRPNTGAPLAPLLERQFPAVAAAVRLTCFEGELVSRGGKQFVEKRFVFADPSIFQVFTFPLRQGKAESALKQPFSVVLTPQTAARYFGGEDPLGKSITYHSGGQSALFTVTGILEPLPAQSHLQFDFIASYGSLRGLIRDDYFFTNHWDSPTWTYVQLKPGTKAEDLQKLLPAFCGRFVDKRSYSSVDCRLLPLARVYTEAGYVIGVSGNSRLYKMLWIIALFILLIACINFTNLATARSETRAREIGMRKVSGAGRGQLVRQFLCESLLFSFLALPLALLLMEMLLPFLAVMVGKSLPFHFFSSWRSLATVLLCGAAVGLLAGAYPAGVLSLMPPRLILKSGRAASSSGGRLRRLLVVGQLVVSVVFIASIMLFSRQVRFLLQKDLGFDKQHVIVIPIRDRRILLGYETLKTRLRQHSAILGVTAASLEPGVGSQNGTSLNARGNTDREIGIIYVDQDFIKTMGIRMLRGRDFSPDIATDARSALLLNEQASKFLGWQDGVGETVETFFKEKGRHEPFFQATVVGITRDFNFRDLTTPMQPILIKIAPNRYECLMVRLDGGRLQEGIDNIRSVWREFPFDQPFEYSFLEQDIGALYQMFSRFITLTGYATALAIIIACLGLFGLASFMTMKRSREIGIRKVLGANEAGLVFLLIREYLLLLAIACFVAWPATYFIVGDLLREFPYRISIGIGTFILAMLMTLALALATVGFQSLRVARANPVDSLRHE